MEVKVQIGEVEVVVYFVSKIPYQEFAMLLHCWTKVFTHFKKTHDSPPIIKGELAYDL